MSWAKWWKETQRKLDVRYQAYAALATKQIWPYLYLYQYEHEYSHESVAISVYVSVCSWACVNCSKALDLFAIKFYWFINAAHHSTVAIKLPTIFSLWEHTRGNREGGESIGTARNAHINFRKCLNKNQYQIYFALYGFIMAHRRFLSMSVKRLPSCCREFVHIISNLYDIFIARNCFAFWAWKCFTLMCKFQSVL